MVHLRFLFLGGLLLLSCAFDGIFARSYYPDGRTCIIKQYHLDVKAWKDSNINADEVFESPAKREAYYGIRTRQKHHGRRAYTIRMQILERCGHYLCNSYHAKIFIYSSWRRQRCYYPSKHSKSYSTVNCHVYGRPIKIVVYWPKYKRRLDVYHLRTGNVIRCILPKYKYKKINYHHLKSCPGKKYSGPKYGKILITEKIQGRTCPTGRLRFPVGSLQSFKKSTLDGRLNNKKRIFQGAVGENLVRLAGNDYLDNISIPSGSCTATERATKRCPFPKENNRTGSHRPNARVISNFLMAQNRPIDSRRGLSDLLAYYGQFIDHDTDLTKELPRTEIQIDPNDLDLPIPVPKGDVIFDPDSKGNQTIKVRRFSFDKCTGNMKCRCPRMHINSISAVLDANTVYGSDMNRSRTLRTLKDGLMKTDKYGNLPLNTFGLPNGNGIERDPTKLRVAGDTRANVAPTLLVLHTLFLREHNRLAKLYKRQNPKANDEEIFQYARKIVIGEMQAITLREYVPAMLGGTYRIPKYRGYNPKVDPSISTEFSSAAFRFGHTQINERIFRYQKNGKISPFGHMLLREGFFRPERVTKEGGIDTILRGSVRHPTQELDVKVVDELRNFMFQKRGMGLDLASINIQRGRELGIPDFNTVRKKLGLKEYTSFQQLTRNRRIASKLKYLYGHINNVDLWVGGVAEDHEHGSELGETFGKIFLDQFLKIRDGDRFWYERILTKKEIEYVNRHTMSRIIELNSGVRKVQPNAFFASLTCRDVKHFQCIRRYGY